ncbi:MAG: 30S ribosome-binding factor RbfA [Phycisphaerales bacterium]|nr:30S ribosome-binding factor RbfA [Phycisphaerales bacterium]
MSRRTERVGSLIRDILAGLIRTRLNDPRIEPLTSITRVDVAADFSLATVHVSVMATEAKRKLTVQALQSASARLRSFMGEDLVLRKLPRLVFELDDSVRRGAEMVNALEQLRAERGEPPDWEVAGENEDQDQAAGPADGASAGATRPPAPAADAPRPGNPQRSSEAE